MQPGELGPDIWGGGERTAGEFLPVDVNPKRCERVQYPLSCMIRKSTGGEQ
jgi:hypothetical protein